MGEAWLRSLNAMLQLWKFRLRSREKGPSCDKKASPFARLHRRLEWFMRFFIDGASEVKEESVQDFRSEHCHARARIYTHGRSAAVSIFCRSKKTGGGLFICQSNYTHPRGLRRSPFLPAVSSDSAAPLFAPASSALSHLLKKKVPPRKARRTPGPRRLARRALFAASMKSRVFSLKGLGGQRATMKLVASRRRTERRQSPRRKTRGTRRKCSARDLALLRLLAETRRKSDFARGRRRRTKRRQRPPSLRRSRHRLQQTPALREWKHLAALRPTTFFLSTALEEESVKPW